MLNKVNTENTEGDDYNEININFKDLNKNFLKS
jgi:hypothetical protein